MVHILNVSQISSSTMLSTNDDTCIVNISTNVTLTLPPILTNGMSYIIIRSDSTSNVLTINTSGTTIDGLSSIVIYGNRSRMFISWNNAWITTFQSSPPGAGTPVFTLAFRENNSNSQITTQTTDAWVQAVVFPYDGTSLYGEPFVEATIVVGTSNSAFGMARLIINGTATVIANFSWTNPGTSRIAVSTTTFANIPADPSLLELQYMKTAASGNGTVDLYSLVIR